MLVLAVQLAGCGSVPHPPYAPQATSALTPIDLPPPPGRIEIIPKRPAGADAWVDGEWVLRHDRWLWLLGRWVEVPAGAKYAPWVTVRSADGTLYYAPSIWIDASGHPVEPPQPLAVATASGEAVFAPGGEVESTGRNIKGGAPPPVDAGTDSATPLKP
jgi:hypothetical protein